MKSYLAFSRMLFRLLLVVPCLLVPEPALAQDEPTIAKDSVQVTAWAYDEYKKNDKVNSWVPKIDFRVNGPIASGSQLYVEFSLPTGRWVEFDCKTEAIPAGSWWEVKECGGREIPAAKGVIHTGPVNFAIRLRNEVTETTATLFTGKMKVAKAPPRARRAPTEWAYYVDHDWNLPIGYIFLKPNSVRKWDLPSFHLAFWIRGGYTEFEPHLFYKGKEVGAIYFQGERVSKGSCQSKVNNEPAPPADNNVPQRAIWRRMECDIPSVVGWDKTGEDRSPRPGWTGQTHVLSENPGEYELKIVSKGELARSIKFTVAADGSFDNGIATANKLGSNRVIVPVKVLELVS